MTGEDPGAVSPREGWERGSASPHVCPLPSGFLDKNNDLLFRNLKEVRKTPGGGLGVWALNDLGPRKLTGLSLRFHCDPCPALTDHVQLRESHPEPVLRPERAQRQEAARDGVKAVGPQGVCVCTCERARCLLELGVGSVCVSSCVCWCLGAHLCVSGRLPVGASVPTLMGVWVCNVSKCGCTYVYLCLCGPLHAFTPLQQTLVVDITGCLGYKNEHTLS